MAFKAGKDSWFALDNIAGTLTVLSPYTDDTSVPRTVAQLEVSAFGTTPKAFITGLTDGDTISIKGPYDPTMFSHLANLKAGQAAGSASSTYMYGPGGSVSGQAKMTGECWVASYQFSSAVGGRVEWSASLQVTGAQTDSTF